MNGSENKLPLAESSTHLNPYQRTFIYLVSNLGVIFFESAQVQTKLSPLFDQ